MNGAFPSVFIECPGGQSIAAAVERNGITKQGIGACRRAFQVRLLRPCTATARKHVNGTGSARSIVGLIAIDLRGGAVLARGADRESVPIAAERNRVAESIAVFFAAGVGCLDIGLLRPRRPGSGENV